MGADFNLHKIIQQLQEENNRLRNHNQQLLMCLKETQGSKLSKRPSPPRHPTSTVNPKPIVTTSELEETLQDVDMLDMSATPGTVERKQTLAEVAEEIKQAQYMSI